MARVRVKVAWPGKHVTPKGEVTITPERCRSMERMHAALRKDGIRFPVPWGHQLSALPADVRLFGPGAPRRPACATGGHPAAAPVGLQGAGPRALPRPHHPPRAAHVDQPCFGWRAHPGRSPFRGRPQQRLGHHSVPAHRSRRHRTRRQPVPVPGGRVIDRPNSKLLQRCNCPVPFGDRVGAGAPIGDHHAD